MLNKRFSISYLSVAVIKYHSQKQLIGEEFILACVSRGLNVHIGREEVMTASQNRKLRDHFSTTHKKQKSNRKWGMAINLRALPSDVLLQHG